MKINKQQAQDLYEAARHTYDSITTVEDLAAYEDLGTALGNIEDDQAPSENRGLSKAARKRHIESGGQVQCPYCEIGGGVVCYEEVEPVEDGGMEQRATCTKCGRRWIDVFTLTDIREICS